MCGCGLPAIVLCIEKEVSADDGDTHSDHYHDEEHQQHEPKHIVNLVLPEGGEDKVPAIGTKGGRGGREGGRGGEGGRAMG